MVKTMRTWGRGAKNFFPEISLRLFDATHNQSAGLCFTQRISIVHNRAMGPAFWEQFPVTKNYLNFFVVINALIERCVDSIRLDSIDLVREYLN